MKWLKKEFGTLVIAPSPFMLLLCCQPISFNKAVGTDHWFWSGVGWDTSLSAESHFSHSVFFAQLLAGLLLLCHTSEEVNFISSLFIASIKSSCIIFSSKWLKRKQCIAIYTEASAVTCETWHCGDRELKWGLLGELNEKHFRLEVK